MIFLSFLPSFFLLNFFLPSFLFLSFFLSFPLILSVLLSLSSLSLSLSLWFCLSLNFQGISNIQPMVGTLMCAKLCWKLQVWLIYCILKRGGGGEREFELQTFSLSWAPGTLSPTYLSRSSVFQKETLDSGKLDTVQSKTCNQSRIKKSEF